MIIRPFEISDVVLNNKEFIKVINKFSSALLVRVKEDPVFWVKWGSKLIVKEENQPFKINHPMYHKYTFKLISLKKEKQQISLGEMLVNKFSLYKN